MTLGLQIENIKNQYVNVNLVPTALSLMVHIQCDALCSNEIGLGIIAILGYLIDFKALIC